MNVNEVVDGIVARARASQKISESDYIGEDGLLHCGVCHQLKECRIEFNGVFRTVPCLCQCGMQEREREKQEMRRKELEDLRKSWVRGYEDMTFENSIASPLMRFAERYIKNWEQIRKDGLSFTLTGNVGCGKTYAAAAIANRVLSLDYRVWMATTSTMLDMLMTSPEVVHNRLAAFDLVVIDDFGAERDTEFAAEKIFQIIDERYRSKLPTLVTTNLNIDQTAPDMTYKRIYSRLQGFAPQMRSKGEDMRQDIGRENRRLAMELLKGD